MNAAVASTHLWPLVAFLGGLWLVVASMLGISYVLGQRHQQRATGKPYEGGMLPTGSARLRVPAPFYLIAMLFLLFGLEAVYLFAWTVAVRETGWPGYFKVFVLVGILVAALLYLWRVGALTWHSTKYHRTERHPPKEVRPCAGR